MSLFTRQFWRDTFERTVSSAAQGFLVGGGLGVGAEVTEAVDARYLPWIAAFSTAGGMAAMTFAKCLTAIRVGAQGTASFVSLPAAPKPKATPRRRRRTTKAAEDPAK